MSTCAAIYVRTSPDCPLSAAEQIERLKLVAGERGWTVDHVFADRPTSVKGPDRRPGETALIAAIRNGVIDGVLVWSIDRIGRTLIELAGFLGVCRVASVSLWVDQQEIDTERSDTLYRMGALMATHLRQTRRDRILRGQAAARALSIRFGRPPLGQGKVDRAKRELAAGKGVRHAARLAGISAASVSRIKNSIGSRAATN